MYYEGGGRRTLESIYDVYIYVPCLDIVYIHILFRFDVVHISKQFGGVCSLFCKGSRTPREDDHREIPVWLGEESTIKSKKFFKNFKKV